MSSRPGGRASPCCAAAGRACGRLAANDSGRMSRRGGIEPLAERFGACSGRPRAAATAPPGQPQSPCPWRVRTIGATPSPGTPGRPARAVPRPGSTRHRREPPASSGRSSRTRRAIHGVDQDQDTLRRYSGYSEDTAIDTCPRRSPGTAAVTAKTPKIGLEIRRECAHRSWRIMVFVLLGVPVGPAVRGRRTQHRRRAGGRCECTGNSVARVSVTQPSDAWYPQITAEEERAALDGADGGRDVRLLTGNTRCLVVQGPGRAAADDLGYQRGARGAWGDPGPLPAIEYLREPAQALAGNAGIDARRSTP